MTIVDLLQLTKNLKELISKVMQKPQGQKSYNYSYNKIRKNTFKQIMMVSGMFVFKLRKFLLQETIMFSLGATDEFGTLYERQISQDELFQKIQGSNRMAMRSSLSSHALMLSRSLETLKEQTMSNFTEVGTLNLWPRILQLAFLGPRIKDNGDDEIANSDPDYYQKDSMDRNVYVRYSQGKKQTLLHYYGKEQKQFFNKGWLYEWYMEYISQSIEHEKELQQSLQKGSLAPLFEGKSMESIEGYRGGDYATAQGQQIQAKYQNQQIITFTSIFTVINDIESILSKWQSADIQTLSQEFVNLFTSDDSSLNKLNKDYNQIIETQLFSLLQIKT